MIASLSIISISPRGPTRQERVAVQHHCRPQRAHRPVTQIPQRSEEHAGPASSLQQDQRPSQISQV